MIRYRYAIGFMVAMLLVAAGFYYLGQRAETTTTTTERNSDAILVSCRLLKNAILESQSGSGEATRLFVGAIKRIMTPKESQQLDAALRRGAALTVPDCARIAEHPDTVRDQPPE